MILAGTGHRPDKLGGFTADVEYQLYELAMNVLIYASPHRVISGMALGWDMALAHAAVSLGIPLTCAVPFKGQDARWTPMQRASYQKMLAYVAATPDGVVHYVCDPGYAPQKMQIRNEWMVDQSTDVLALWNGDAAGGTFNCIRYAESRDVPVHNVWNTWSSRAI